uniref:Uncharacterized protein n=1 Tax=Rhizophora mucronata TaxID=61149 RepID=A0A2P2NLS7_RHIMU
MPVGLDSGRMEDS